jgi:hypothetical protein
VFGEESVTGGAAATVAADSPETIMTLSTTKQPTNKQASRTAKFSLVSVSKAAKPVDKTVARPRHQPKLATTDTKQSRLIALMRRSKGATLAELTKVTGWQAHSVRGLISGVLRKKQGLTITLDKQAGGKAAYRIQA